jgi:NADH-quinone oxidoreductase subunit C/D
MTSNDLIIDDLKKAFGKSVLALQETKDNIPTLWVSKDRVRDVLHRLKNDVDRPYKMLYDLTAIDERVRSHRDGQPASDFTIVYHLLSFDRNEDIRIKVPLAESSLSLPSVTGLWESANWYEREVWDMFGIKFVGHPHLTRILMPPTWKGHPLRKDHPARATEMGPFRLPDEKEVAEQTALQFKPEDWGMKQSAGDTDFMFLNLGPQHPGTHGLIRFILQLDGEEIVDSVLDIGYHHRGAEKMGERQTWHTYIPYTDRIDYFGGVMNNLAYCLAV